MPVVARRAANSETCPTAGVRPVCRIRSTPKVRGRSSFTITELLFAVLLFSVASLMLFTLLSFWRRIEGRVNVRSALLLDGSGAVERVVRSIRAECLEPLRTRYAAGNFQNAFIFLADTNADGLPDSLKGWGLKVMDLDRNGAQDLVDSNGDGAPDTPLWELVEAKASTTNLASAVWKVTVLCQNLVAPWTSSDGRHQYRPFSYSGSDPRLDSDNDGFISESEIGNFVTANGLIDHVSEVAKITAIHFGLKLVKVGARRDVESVILYQGTITPRNWQPLDKYYHSGNTP